MSCRDWVAKVGGCWRVAIRTPRPRSPGGVWARPWSGLHRELGRVLGIDPQLVLDLGNILAANEIGPFRSFDDPACTRVETAGADIRREHPQVGRAVPCLSQLPAAGGQQSTAHTRS